MGASCFISVFTSTVRTNQTVKTLRNSSVITFWSPTSGDTEQDPDYGDEVWAKALARFSGSLLREPKKAVLEDRATIK